jgi:hypothetical protein
MPLMVVKSGAAHTSNQPWLLLPVPWLLLLHQQGTSTRVTPAAAGGIRGRLAPMHSPPAV